MLRDSIAQLHLYLWVIIGVYMNFPVQIDIQLAELLNNRINVVFINAVGTDVYIGGKLQLFLFGCLILL